MPSIFSRIVFGDFPCYKIAENDNYLAFLDINPLTKGHTLVIPKLEIDYLFDLDEKTYQGLFQFSKKVALGLKKAIPCNRISLQVIGLEVPHAHIHLIPINSMNDCNFSNVKFKFSPEEFTSIASAINSQIDLNN